jgi:hypothetical protein
MATSSERREPSGDFRRVYVIRATQYMVASFLVGGLIGYLVGGLFDLLIAFIFCFGFGTVFFALLYLAVRPRARLPH